METIRHLEKDGTRYASFFHAIEADGPRFVSRQTDEFQFGVIERPKGYEVSPHIHPRVPHTIDHVSEFLFVEQGKMEVTVYDESWKVLGTETFKTGDFLILYRGGHSLKMLEPTRIVEVKQGPYPGDDAAKIFKDPEKNQY